MELHGSVGPARTTITRDRRARGRPAPDRLPPLPHRGRALRRVLAPLRTRRDPLAGPGALAEDRRPGRAPAPPASTSSTPTTSATRRCGATSLRDETLVDSVAADHHDLLGLPRRGRRGAGRRLGRARRAAAASCSPRPATRSTSAPGARSPATAGSAAPRRSSWPRRWSRAPPLRDDRPVSALGVVVLVSRPPRLLRRADRGRGRRRALGAPHGSRPSCARSWATTSGASPPSRASGCAPPAAARSAAPAPWSSRTATCASASGCRTARRRSPSRRSRTSGGSGGGSARPSAARCCA